VKAAERTEIQDYLAAVERETSTLPADRRQELVADLAEHIEVALAERPGAVRDVLRDLGDPRLVAATALDESGQTGPTVERRRGRVPASVPVVLLALCQVFAWAIPVLGLALRVAGLILLWTSRHWTAGQKIVGTLLAVVLPVTLVALQGQLTHATTAVALWNVLLIVLSLGTAGWLWRARR
jgi:uncharacterized membrane protein